MWEVKKTDFIKLDNRKKLALLNYFRNIYWTKTISKR